MWVHPRNESKGAKLERESQPVMPPRPDLPDVVGPRAMAQQSGAVRRGTVYRALNRRPCPYRTIRPTTGIESHLDFYACYSPRSPFTEFGEKGDLFRWGDRLNCNGAITFRRWTTSQSVLLKPLTDNTSMEPAHGPGWRLPRGLTREGRSDRFWMLIIIHRLIIARGES